MNDERNFTRTYCRAVEYISTKLGIFISFNSGLEDTSYVQVNSITKHLDATMAILAIGDKKNIKTRLEKLGYDVVVLIKLEIISKN